MDELESLVVVVVVEDAFEVIALLNPDIKLVKKVSPYLSII